MPDPIPVFNSPAPLNPDDFAPPVQSTLEVYVAPSVEPVPATPVTIGPNQPYPTAEVPPS